MPEEKTIILEPQKIHQKLERIAYEILENNYDEKEIILAGLNKRGLFVAETLADFVQKIMNIKVQILPISVDDNDITNVKTEVHIEKGVNGKVVVIVDDVANSGRTLLYAMKPFMEFTPKKIQIAVLVDRKHKLFPIAPDYVGLSLATTIQEHITVHIEKGQFESVYLT